MKGIDFLEKDGLLGCFWNAAALSKLPNYQNSYIKAIIPRYLYLRNPELSLERTST
jgi:hypothetical protein